MQHILILSQDRVYREVVVSLLKDNGYFAYASESSGDAADQIYSKKIDLIIVDIASWKGEGVKVYKQLKQELGTTPFHTIIITEREVMEKITFSLAFDDFVIKEQNPQEVLLRIKQLLWRQSRLDTENIIKIEDLTIDLNSYEVMVKGKLVYLTYKEYELLKFLALNRGRVYTRETLLDKVWGYDNYVGTRTVDIHIQRLRTKLGGKYNEFLQTVRNVGYCFAGNKP